MGIPVPLFGLTATASYDVLADIQRELSGYGSYQLEEDSLVRFESTIRPEIQFFIEDVSIPNIAYQDIWKLKKALGSAKRKRIFELLDNLPEALQVLNGNTDLLFTQKDWEENHTLTSERAKSIRLENYNPNQFFTQANGGLIFCPHKSGAYGITDQFKPERFGSPVNLEGIFDHVSQRSEIRPGYFMGAGDEQDENSLVIVEESIKNQDLFKKNKLNVMVATKAFGMGIDKPNIRYTIHLNYPGSIESFVQEAGRAGRDRDLAIAYLLINRQTFQIEGETDRLDHDQEINFYFHNNSFKGISKEMAVLDELLTEIYFPDRTAEIENLILQELEVELNCKYWEGGVNKRLYINSGFNSSLGFIDLNTLTINTNNTINQDLSLRVLNLVVNYIRNLNLKVPAWEWIQLSDKEAGIERLLEAKSNGDSYKVEVGFINNHKERIKTLADWIRRILNENRFTDEEMKKIRAKCNNSDDFIEEIQTKYESLTGNKIELRIFFDQLDRKAERPLGETFRRFSAYFNGYRNKQDTERAIYRLTTLGVIDDYTVNFNSNTFTLYGIKKADKEYRHQVEVYLKKFYSEKAAKQRLKEIDKFDEPTYLRKSLHFLIQFVYESIKQKRSNAIKEMRDACIQTIEKGKDGNLFLREYIDLYFNSKYARIGYFFTDEKGNVIPASLTDITENGKSFDLKVVWNFMEYVSSDSTGTEVENTKHLRGACIRMITNSPENYVFRLLNAFTLFMLEFRNKRLMEEAIEQLVIGFEKLAEFEKLEDNLLKRKFEKYYDLVVFKNELLQDWLITHEIEFSFEIITLTRTVKKVSSITNSLKLLNKTLG
ncbi:hypothetical protein H4075_19835 [Lacibacter sediminis]|uniref:Helicase C-terminal domain-containing protein n=2 Tax=Lacibacter sediminis TaxID=2760713 RepID=A0A7G5XN00_9BACT|nr:hypothetical protein H4075_19835 [Lacibacter sediminis]